MKRLVIFYILSIFQVGKSRELKFVQAIWRHGDRAPSKLSYPNNPYNESYWPRGWDQLTNLGMQQLYELGQFFHQRYSKSFVNETFNVHETYIRSSSSDRSLTSAQTMLYGFFPATGSEIWDSGLNWQPIPVHAGAPDNRDPLLKPTSLECPTYDKAYEKYSKNFIQSMTHTYVSFFQFLGNVTGYGQSITFDEVLDLSNINREIAHNLTQPKWVYQKWTEFSNKTTLEIVTEIDVATRILEFNNEKLYYLRGGYILGDFVNRAKKVASGEQKEPSKMVLYSSHDGTLLSLMYAMQVADNQTIPYAGCIIMEIWENDNEDYVVELFYRKNQYMLNLTVPGCTQSCPVNEFYDLLKDYAIFEEEKLYRECGLEYCSPGAIKNSIKKKKNKKKFCD